jgi:hypothetical protein
MLREGSAAPNSEIRIVQVGGATVNMKFCKNVSAFPKFVRVKT